MQLLLSVLQESRHSPDHCRFRSVKDFALAVLLSTKRRLPIVFITYTDCLKRNGIDELLLWTCLLCVHFSNSVPPTSTPSLGMPTWFRMVTLLAFDLFVHTKVDVAVIEVGVGGRACELDRSDVVVGSTLALCSAQMQQMSCNRWSVESQHWDLITCACWAILCRKLRAKKPGSEPQSNCFACLMQRHK